MRNGPENRAKVSKSFFETLFQIDLSKRRNLEILRLFPLKNTVNRTLPLAVGVERSLTPSM